MFKLKYLICNMLQLTVPEVCKKCRVSIGHGVFTLVLGSWKQRICVCVTHGSFHVAHSSCMSDGFFSFDMVYASAAFCETCHFAWDLQHVGTQASHFTCCMLFAAFLKTFQFA